MRSQLTVLKACWLRLGLMGYVGLMSFQVQANDLDLSITSPVPQNELPVLVLLPQKAANKIHVTIKSHGKKVDETFRSAVKGRRLELSLPQTSVGVWQWKGHLRVEFADGSAGRMPLSFGTEVRRPPVLKLHSDGLDLKKKEVTVKLNRPAQKVSLEVIDENGVKVASIEKAYTRQAAGRPLKLRWTSTSTTPVMKITLVGHDSDGFFSPTLALYPWSLAIPHEEVMFETASHELLSAETPKLKSARLAMNQRIAKYKELIPIKLFVLGHTDSVGEKGRNAKLSKQRASAIAKWFVAQGVTVPVFARGFGESELRIATGDEVDEPMNRRVDYILAVEPPSHRSWRGWKTIQGLKPAGDRE